MTDYEWHLRNRELWMHSHARREANRMRTRAYERAMGSHRMLEITDASYRFVPRGWYDVPNARNS